MRAKRFLILDACVLIDFCKVDRSILSVVSAHVGQIHVPSPVLAEVDQLEEAEAMALGIEIVEPEIDQLVAAGATRAGLSFEDRLITAVVEGAELASERHAPTIDSYGRKLRTSCAPLSGREYTRLA